MQTRLTKRIPVEEKTWVQHSRLKEPGETYDDLLNRLMEHEAGMRLTRDAPDPGPPEPRTRRGL